MNAGEAGPVDTREIHRFSSVRGTLLLVGHNDLVLFCARLCRPLCWWIRRRNTSKQKETFIITESLVL